MRGKSKAIKTTIMRLPSVSLETLAGAKVIAKPISVASLKRMVAKLEPQEGRLSPSILVSYKDDSSECYVSALVVEAGDGTGRLALLVMTPPGRRTPLITKNHGEKIYKSLDKLIRQMIDVSGKGAHLSAQFSLDSEQQEGPA